jgi:ADP-ribosylation factor protein 1
MGCLISKSSENDNDSSIVSQGPRKLKIVMVGLDGAGKTSILYYFKN